MAAGKDLVSKIANAYQSSELRDRNPGPEDDVQDTAMDRAFAEIVEANRVKLARKNVLMHFPQPDESSSEEVRKRRGFSDAEEMNADGHDRELLKSASKDHHHYHHYHYYHYSPYLLFAIVLLLALVAWQQWHYGHQTIAQPATVRSAEPVASRQVPDVVTSSPTAETRTYTAPATLERPRAAKRRPARASEAADEEIIWHLRPR